MGSEKFWKMGVIYDKMFLLFWADLAKKIKIVCLR